MGRAEIKLCPCKKCGLPTRHLQIHSHLRPLNGKVVLMFCIICNCDTRMYFASHRETCDQWNGANR
jgi:hypothetical protein